MEDRSEAWIVFYEIDGMKPRISGVFFDADKAAAYCAEQIKRCCGMRYWIDRAPVDPAIIDTRDAAIQKLRGAGNRNWSA